MYTMKGFYYETAEQRQQRLDRLRAAQQIIDNCADPEKKLQLNRKRYKCGDNYVTPAQIESWPTTIAELAAASAAEQGGPEVRPQISGGGVGAWFSRKQLLKWDAHDFQRRFSVDPALNAKISLHRGDITSLELDAIVNAANRDLLGGGGVDGAIHDAAGPLLREACRPLNGAETGETKMTAGFALPAKFVLHTVGPVERGDRQLRSCYRGCLDLCIKHGLKTVAFCGIGTGIYGFPLKRASHIALDETRKFLMSLKNGTYKSVEEQERAERKDGGAPQAKAVAVASASGASSAPSLNDIERIVFCVFTDEELQCYTGLTPSYFPIDGFPGQSFDAGQNPEHDDFNRDDARPPTLWNSSGGRQSCSRLKTEGCSCCCC